ncbi:hypothetical protein GCM10023333_23160 [Ferrimonas pelagia]|uniref:Uncharacterized protein n=2 Tax=Ferrimonas pelagia TaxID=1177826 RepID=A0ABP9EY10_9GAMM
MNPVVVKRILGAALMAAAMYSLVIGVIGLPNLYGILTENAADGDDPFWILATFGFFSIEMIISYAAFLLGFRTFRGIRVSVVTFALCILAILTLGTLGRALATATVLVRVYDWCQVDSKET